jgi:hypothetical protein
MSMLIFGLLTASLMTEPQAIVQFQRAVDDYAFLHRRLERGVPPLEVTANSETLRAAIDTMAAAMRAARPDARQGDFFAPDVQDVLRARIARALSAHGLTPADVHAAEMADRLDRRPVSLKVNESFPWAVAAAMFPCVLEALPALPPELQYRIVGNDLVLIDVHAGLVIDVLPFALDDSDDPIR